MTFPTAVLTDPEWDLLLNHLGYGNPDGHLWFLGMEEHLDDPSKRDDELRWRVASLAHPIDTLEHLRNGTLPGTYTWRLMAKLARLLLEDRNDWDDPTEAVRYVLDGNLGLGSAAGDTFLCELLPLPEVGRGAFSYGDRYRNRQAYHAAVLPDRMAGIRDLADRHHPELILCYGREFWTHYKEIWTEVDFQEYAIPYGERQRRAYVAAGLGHSSTIVLTPFFRPSLFPIVVAACLPDIVEEHTLQVIS